MADLGDDDSSNQTPSQQSHTPISGDGGGPSWLVGRGSHGGDDGKQATQEEAPGGGDQPFMAVGDYHIPIIPPPPPPPAAADPEQGNPMVCIMCGRLFSSDRSLSGHMKVHGGRDWRGSYPPPTFSIQEFYDDENAVAHLNPPSPDEGDGNGGVMEEEEEEENLSNEEDNVIPDLNK